VLRIIGIERFPNGGGSFFCFFIFLFSNIFVFVESLMADAGEQRDRASQREEKRNDIIPTAIGAKVACDLCLWTLEVVVTLRFAPPVVVVAADSSTSKKGKR
jgi:hypothetical protein